MTHGGGQWVWRWDVYSGVKSRESLILYANAVSLPTDGSVNQISQSLFDFLHPATTDPTEIPVISTSSPNQNNINRDISSAAQDDQSLPSHHLLNESRLAAMIRDQVATAGNLFSNSPGQLPTPQSPPAFTICEQQQVTQSLPAIQSAVFSSNVIRIIQLQSVQLSNLESIFPITLFLHLQLFFQFMSRLICWLFHGKN